MHNNHSSEFESFWACSIDDLLAKLKVDKNQGLSEEEVTHRLYEYGRNSLKIKQRFPTLKLLFSQFNTPFDLPFAFCCHHFFSAL
jgi:magnesium-transporting ATPase (P-type)